MKKSSFHDFISLFFFFNNRLTAKIMAFLHFFFLLLLRIKKKKSVDHNESTFHSFNFRVPDFLKKE